MVHAPPLQKCIVQESLKIHMTTINNQIRNAQIRNTKEGAKASRKLQQSVQVGLTPKYKVGDSLMVADERGIALRNQYVVIKRVDVRVTVIFYFCEVKAKGRDGWVEEKHLRSEI